MIELMKLPFKESALAPYVSEETVQFHYGKHHKAYVDKVNELISGTEFQDTPLEEIIERTFDKPEYQVLYNNAGQVFNHNVYWNSIGIGEKFDADMQERIAERFETRDALREKLADEVVKLFGSGWVWLAENGAGELVVVGEQNAGNPMCRGMKPLLAIDVWEHAYYIDYRNRRADYVKNFWDIVDWKVIEKRFKK